MLSILNRPELGINKKTNSEDKYNIGVDPIRLAFHVKQD